MLQGLSLKIKAVKWVCQRKLRGQMDQGGVALKIGERHGVRLTMGSIRGGCLMGGRVVKERFPRKRFYKRKRFESRKGREKF